MKHYFCGFSVRVDCPIINIDAIVATDRFGQVIKPLVYNEYHYDNDFSEDDTERLPIKGEHICESVKRIDAYYKKHFPKSKISVSFKEEQFRELNRYLLETKE